MLVKICDMTAQSSPPPIYSIIDIRYAMHRIASKFTVSFIHQRESLWWKPLSLFWESLWNPFPNLIFDTRKTAVTFLPMQLFHRTPNVSHEIFELPGKLVPSVIVPDTPRELPDSRVGHVNAPRQVFESGRLGSRRFYFTFFVKASDFLSGGKLRQIGFKFVYVLKWVRAKESSNRFESKIEHCGSVVFLRVRLTTSRTHSLPLWRCLPVDSLISKCNVPYHDWKFWRLYGIPKRGRADLGFTLCYLLQ